MRQEEKKKTKEEERHHRHWLEARSSEEYKAQIAAGVAQGQGEEEQERKDEAATSIRRVEALVLTAAKACTRRTEFQGKEADDKEEELNSMISMIRVDVVARPCNRWATIQANLIQTGPSVDQVGDDLQVRELARPERRLHQSGVPRLVHRIHVDITVDKAA